MAEKQERIVEARVLKNTSRQGHLMHAGTVVQLPISVAKAMQKGGLVAPVVRPIPSHPAPPPPPPPVFEDSGDAEADPEGGE